LAWTTNYWNKKKNQKEIYEIINQGIREAIRKTLPIKTILKEYLKGEIVKNFNEQEFINKIKELVVKDLEKNNINNVLEKKRYQENNNKTQDGIDDSSDFENSQENSQENSPQNSDKKLDEIKNKISEIEGSFDFDNDNKKIFIKDSDKINIDDVKINESKEKQIENKENKKNEEKCENKDDMDTQKELEKLIEKTDKTLNPIKQHDDFKKIVSDSIKHYQKKNMNQFIKKSCCFTYY